MRGHIYRHRYVQPGANKSAIMKGARCFFILQLLLVLASSSFSAQPADPLRVLVPLKLGFTQFVSWSGLPANASFDGFSVQVFRGAVQGLPFTYNFVPFGDGRLDPSYDDMVEMVSNGVLYMNLF